MHHDGWTHRANGDRYPNDWFAILKAQAEGHLDRTQKAYSSERVGTFDEARHYLMLETVESEKRVTAFDNMRNAGPILLVKYAELALEKSDPNLMAAVLMQEHSEPLILDIAYILVYCDIDAVYSAKEKRWRKGERKIEWVQDMAGSGEMKAVMKWPE